MTLPGTSYLLLAPALAGGLAGLLASFTNSEHWPGGADLATTLAGCLVLLPPAWLLYPALGHVAGPAAAATIALATLPLAALAGGLSLRARLSAAAAPALLAGVGLAAALALPVADVDSPERIIVYFHQDAVTGRARILAHSDLGRLPIRFCAAAAFSSFVPRVAFGWGKAAPVLRGRSHTAPRSRTGGRPARDLSRRRRRPFASPDPLPARRAGAPDCHPTRRSTSAPSPSTGSRCRCRCPSWRAGTAAGGSTGFRRARRGLWSRWRSPRRGRSRLVVADQSSGLPPAADAVATARPPWAVTLQEGDLTLFTRTVRVEPAR